VLQHTELWWSASILLISAKGGQRLAFVLYCTVHLWVHGMQLDGHGIIKGGKCVGMGMRRVCGNRGEVGLWRVRALLEWTVTDLCGCTLQCCAVCGGAWFPPHSILVMHGCRIMVASFNFCNR
jgi:hypothetical protein